MIQFVLASIFISGASGSIVGIRCEPLELQCSHIRQLAGQFDVGDPDRLIKKSAAISNIDYKRFWYVDQRLTSVLGITPEEEKLLVLHKMIEFTKQISERTDVSACMLGRDGQKNLITVLSSLVAIPEEYSVTATPLNRCLNILLRTKANSLNDRHAKKMARKLIRSYHVVQTPAFFNCLAYRIQAKYVLKEDLC